jgi:hypothetical protein
MKPRRRRSISTRRKGLYTVGLVIQVLGVLTILSCFVGFIGAGQAAVGSFGRGGSDPAAWFLGFFGGMVATAVGGMMRHVASRGIAGSGLLLDPERARDDLEPWARTGGGLLRDVLDEAGVDAPARRDDPVVKVRCRECGTLNDEDARFCDACGGKL